MKRYFPQLRMRREEECQCLFYGLIYFLCFLVVLLELFCNCLISCIRVCLSRLMSQMFLSLQTNYFQDSANQSYMFLFLFFFLLCRFKKLKISHFLLEKTCLKKLVRKVLYFLPKCFNVKVTAIKETQDISFMNVDELIRSLFIF